MLVKRPVEHILVPTHMLLSSSAGPLAVPSQQLSKVQPPLPPDPLLRNCYVI